LKLSLSSSLTFNAIRKGPNPLYLTEAGLYLCQLSKRHLVVLTTGKVLFIFINRMPFLAAKTIDYAHRPGISIRFYLHHVGMADQGSTSSIKSIEISIEYA